MADGDLNVANDLDVAGDARVEGDARIEGVLRVDDWINRPRVSGVAIASGVFAPAGEFCRINTEGNAGSDDLTQLDMTGKPNGFEFVLQTVSGSQNIVVVHGSGNGVNAAGNIRCQGAANITTTGTKDILLCKWIWAATDTDGYVMVRRWM